MIVKVDFQNDHFSLFFKLNFFLTSIIFIAFSVYLPDSGLLLCCLYFWRWFQALLFSICCFTCCCIYSNRPVNLKRVKTT